MFSALILFLLASAAWPQGADYKAIFGKDWAKAEQFIDENRSWMKQMAARYRVSYPVAAAVVFPELVRYSAIRDKVEITLLKALYISLGNQYSDFSVGPFQMKPSFAEYMCAAADTLRGRALNRLKNKTGKDDIREFRRSIVSDLEQARSQFIYLAAFIKLSESKYGLEKAGDPEKVRILSAAYNCGPDKSLERVKEMAGQMYFNTKLYRTENYSYSDISLYWYRNFTASTGAAH